MAHKKPLLTKRPKPKPRKKMPVSKARTGVQSQNSALPNNAKSVAFCSFVPLQRKTQFLWQNLIAKAAKEETGKLSKNSALQNS